MKNIRLKVSPPDGTVSLSAPHATPDRELLQLVRGRLDWIQRQQNIIRSQPQAIHADPVDGDPILLWGQKLPLRLQEITHTHNIRSTTAGFVRESDSAITVASSVLDTHTVASALDQFYRDQLRARIPALAARWQPVVGREASFWGIKKMKTRWGSCNTQRARIWLNLELTKHPPECLNYVVVHELVHLFERHHNTRFYQRIANAMPDWELWHNYLKNQ